MFVSFVNKSIYYFLVCIKIQFTSVSACQKKVLLFISTYKIYIFCAFYKDRACIPVYLMFSLV